MDASKPAFAGGPDLAGCRLAVVGLGLMGGSLALAARGHCREIIGVDADPAATRAALDRGVVDRRTDLAGALDCDLLVLAAPVRVILDILRALEYLPRPDKPVAVLDLGSTKAAITGAMRDLPGIFDPIGGHPMCGREVSGLAHASADLFRGRTFVLTPLARTSPGTIALAEALSLALGARPLRMDPKAHDVLAARTSHLPYLVSAALVRVALAAQEPGLWDLAASGFKDTTRLAASDLTMMSDILLTNRQAVLVALQAFGDELEWLRKCVSAGDADALHAALAPAREQRLRLTDG